MPLNGRVQLTNAIVNHDLANKMGVPINIAMKDSTFAGEMI